MANEVTQSDDSTTERQRLETLARERGELLALVSQANRALADDRPLCTILQEVVNAMANRLSAAFAGIWTCDEQERALELQASYGNSPQANHDATPGCVEVSAIREQRSGRWTNHVAGRAELADPEWVKRERVVSFAGYPLLVSGKVVGGLVVFSRQPLSETALIVLESLSWSIAQATERRRTQLRLEASERWFSTTLSSIGDAVVVTDTNGKVTFLNPVAATLTAWSPEQATGHSLADVFPIFNELTGAIVESPVDKVLREGTIVGLAKHTVLRQRGGKLIPIEDSAAPVRDSDGALTGVVLVFRDASEARRAEQEQKRLFALEQEARASAEHARDRSEILLQTSRALAQGLEIDATLRRLVEVIAPQCFDWASIWVADSQRRVRRLVHAPSVALDQEAPDEPSLYSRLSPSHPVQKAVNDQETLVIPDLTAWMKQVGGSDEDVAVVRRLDLCRNAVIPIRSGGAIVAALSVADNSARLEEPFDVTLAETIAHQAGLALDNAKLYARAEQLRAAAEDASLVKDQFLARVSHDLRNPLGSILGWAALLRSQRHDATYVAKGLDIIERNAKSQVQLIEDLLDVARITSGKLKLDLASVAVASAIEVALDSARLAADAKGIVLELHVDSDIGMVAMDPDRFQQVIWNLASNAVKFSEKGSKVTVKAARSGSRLKVQVADQGRGIAPEFLPHVFNKFEQAGEGQSRAGGLGLGLAIARHLVELHGGTIGVESAGLGHGAHFTFTIPIRATLPSRPLLMDEVHEPLPTALTGVKILVADDEEDAREVLTAILEQAGATVIAASSADDALRLLQAERPAALVSDVQMPRKSGYELVRAVRSLHDEELRRVPAIALTALARAADRVRALSAGFTAHVAKPVEPAELVLAVAGLLGR